MSIKTEAKLVIGKRYNFPEQSTLHVEVTETIENWIEFHEKEFIWHGNYRATWRDHEDPETKVISDKEQESFYHYTFCRDLIGYVEYYYDMELQLWMVNVLLRECDKVLRLGMGSKEKAQRMYTYFCQYKGFEHY